MKHVTDLIQLFVSGELEPSSRQGVEDHLKECPDCQAEAERERRLWDSLEAVRPSSRQASVWPAVQARTFGKDGTSGASADWFFGSGRLVRGVLATAAVAAGLVLGVLLPAPWEAESTGDETVAESSWLSASSWLSESSWLGGDQAPGIDDLLLGVELESEVSGS